MMRSLYSGVAGLKVHQTGMDVVGNNIANVNTTGFKSFRATYQDSLYQTSSGASAPRGNDLGGVNPFQVGLGVNVSSVDKNFTDGSVQSTGLNTDLCLSGDGLFVIENAASGVFYTRNGAFKFDADGNYVTSDGLFVMGKMNPADQPNDYTPLITDIKDTEIINIPASKTMDAKDTTEVKYTKNLNANEPDGSNPPTPATELQTTFTVFDTLGKSHTIPLVFRRTSVANDEWSVELPGGAATYTITEPEDGSTTTVSLTAYTLQFNPDGSYASPTTNVAMSIAYTNGATTPQSVDIDLTGLTQYAGSNTISGKADGYAAGSLVERNIDKTGMIVGTYSNGEKRNEAIIAIAQFNNAGGLTVNGGSRYTESNNSGTPNVKTAPDLGVTITGSALEMSNVDLAQEFTTMIVTQRGFQSNSKIITVSDEMLETLINIKR